MRTLFFFNPTHFLVQGEKTTDCWPHSLTGCLDGLSRNLNSLSRFLDNLFQYLISLSVCLHHLSCHLDSLSTRAVQKVMRMLAQYEHEALNVVTLHSSM